MLLDARGLLNQLRYALEVYLKFKHSTQIASGITMAVYKLKLEQKTKVVMRMSDNMRQSWHII